MTKTPIPGMHLLIRSVLFSLHLLCCHFEGTYTFNVLPPESLSSVALRHSLAGREPDHFSIHRTTSRSTSLKVSCQLDLDNKKKQMSWTPSRGWEIKSMEIEELPVLEVSREQVTWDVSGYYLEGKELIAASSTSYCYVIATRLWSQHAPDLGKCISYIYQTTKRLSTVGVSQDQKSICSWFWPKYKQPLSLTLTNQTIL